MTSPAEYRWRNVQRYENVKITKSLATEKPFGRVKMRSFFHFSNVEIKNVDLFHSTYGNRFATSIGLHGRNNRRFWLDVRRHPQLYWLISRPRFVSSTVIGAIRESRLTLLVLISLVGFRHFLQPDDDTSTSVTDHAIGRCETDFYVTQSLIRHNFAASAYAIGWL